MSSRIRELLSKPKESLTVEEKAYLENAARLQSAKEQQLTSLLGAGDMRGLTLMNQISQETFDEAVRENVEEFGMTMEEAIQDAISQFGAQGASLQNVNVKSFVNQPIDSNNEQ